MARTQQETKFVQPVVTPKPIDLSQVDIRSGGSMCDLALLARIESIENETLIQRNINAALLERVQALEKRVSDTCESIAQRVSELEKPTNQTAKPE